MSGKPSKSSLARVIRQFEDRKTRVELYHNESEDFRSLCEDFAVCERALEKWQASDAAMADQRRQEYADLLVELRSEIEEWLEQQSIGDQTLDATGRGGPGEP